MTDEIHIKQFELSEKDALFAFLREVYADNARQSEEKFWHWHYCESPLASENDIPLWVAKHGDEIVGQLGAIPVELSVNGETRKSVWILDLIIRIDFRRHGLAKKLVLAINSSYPTMLGVNTMEQHAPKMLQSLGWVIAGKINRYSKLVSAGNSVKEISGIKALRAIVNTAFSVFRAKHKTHLAIRKVERFDQAFDRLWREARLHRPCAIVRTSAFLNWQYVDQPGKKFDVFGYYSEGKLLGYIVLFVRKPNEKGVIAKAAITDIFCAVDAPAEVIDELLKAALNFAMEKGVGSLVTDIVDERVEERLRKLGFWAVKNPLQLMTISESDTDKLYDIKNWYLTRGDSDTSIFEAPNL
jgi:Acetyltransferase (GNAT) domain